MKEGFFGDSVRIKRFQSEDKLYPIMVYSDSEVYRRGDEYVAVGYTDHGGPIDVPLGMCSYRIQKALLQKYMNTECANQGRDLRWQIDQDIDERRELLRRQRRKELSDAQECDVYGINVAHGHAMRQLREERKLQKANIFDLKKHAKMKIAEIDVLQQ
jgi:hypothetical protein